MRRAQNDFTSQPVRNFVRNPSFNFTNVGLQTLRENLCWNPSMLGVTGDLAQVRINRCPSPRGVVSLPHYSGNLAQTITPNVAVTAPEGITSAQRFSYGPSASNPGIAILSGLMANTTYTMSAYVYIESLTSTPGNGGFAENGVISGTALDIAKIGEWQKITWTRTTTATPGSNFGIRFAAVGGTGTGSILITGIVVEIASAGGESPVFFDGNTPSGSGFTYRWTGTANNSISEQNAPTVGSISPRWFGSGGGAGANYQSLGTGIGGSVSYRKLWKTANTGSSNDTGFSVTIPVTSGFSYTASVHQNPSFATNLTVFVIWKDASDAIISQSPNSQGIASPAGVWTRHFATSVAPQGAVNGMFVFGPYVVGSTSAPPTPAGATIDWDNCQIEQSPVMTNYFDVATVHPDLTYSWSSTANASRVLERGNTVGGAFSGKSTGVGYVDSKHYHYWSTAEDGARTVKFVSPAGTPSSNWRLAGFVMTNISVAIDPFPIKAGGRYTVLMRYRAYGWGANQTFQTQMADQTSQNTVISYDPSRIINTNGWVDYRRSFTALRDATYATTWLMALPLVPPVDSDGVFEVRNLMITSGDYTGDFIDGSTPFSKWEGTPNQSTSIGYAPQFLDIAGKPLVDLSTVGSVDLPGGFGTSEARTFYTVFNNLKDISDGQVYPILTYGATALNDVIPNQYITLRQQAATGASNTISARRTGGAGANMSGAFVGVVVCSWGIKSDGRLFMVINNGPVGELDMQVMDVAHERINIQAPTAFSSHIRTIMFRGYHDATTRAAVSRYLGNKYGAKVA